MEPILVYGHPAGSSLGLIAALEWLGQPYRLCRVDMLGEMGDAAYARINARHETPVLITVASKALTETMAIAAHFEARDTERRISFEPLSSEADRMHQLMAFLNTGFTGAFSALWVAMELEQSDPTYQKALRRFGRDNVTNRHNKLEDMVGEGPWLIGEKHSLADALLAGVARWLEIHDVGDIARWPRLAAIRRHVESDPAFTYALALENGEKPEGTGACLGHIELADLIARFGR